MNFFNSLFRLIFGRPGGGAAPRRPPATPTPAPAPPTPAPPPFTAAPAAPLPDVTSEPLAAPSPPSEQNPTPAPDPTPNTDVGAPGFPPKPDFPPLVGNNSRKAVFGAFDYVAEPLPDNRENIRILGTWKADNIVTVPIPQLKKALGPRAPSGMEFHRLGATQLQALWSDWEGAGLLDRILSYDGAFVPRFQRGSTTALSNHAYGSAFDLNWVHNQLGHVPARVGEAGFLRDLVPFAHKRGFYWGGHFESRPDGMHFEIAKPQ